MAQLGNPSGGVNLSARRARRAKGGARRMIYMQEEG
ncbi:MAG: hypothetical protein QOF02_3830 [Blastocatellia bacterium]|nr:hypothetical protein [Blastocatellia bacterium]